MNKDLFALKIKNIYIPPGYIILLIIGIIILTGSIILSETSSNADSTPPTIAVESKDFSVYQGDQAQIIVNFSDNVKVSEATLFYRKESQNTWESVSILSQSYNLLISDDETNDYQYYVTVDDNAGNGPVGDPTINGSQFYIISVLKKTTSDENITLKRPVFIEEGTATWCSNCPEATSVIHDTYELQTIPFYYVTMVEDENQKAKQRLENNYNIYGYPSVYMDGGYQTLVGTQNIIDNFDSALAEAADRQGSKIKLTLQSEWNESQHKLTNTVYCKNYEKTTYTGRLKVYITEIKSQWTNYNGDSYHFSFLDYGINKDISLLAGENKSIVKEWIASESGFDVVKENLWVVAVLFDDEKHTKYSNTDSQKNQYDAYYADAATASRVTEGVLPPTIGLKTPKPYNHYILGNERKNKLLSSTYILGKITIETNVESELSIEKVTFDISGRKTNISTEITSSPYQYVWDTFAIGSHTITATIYDENGRTDSDSINVWVFIL